MRHMRHLLAIVLVAGGATACATSTAENMSEAATAQEPGIAGADFILEVHNPMPHAMTVVAWVGGSQTTLGTVAANETKRFNIPNRGDDSVRLSATDEGKTHTVDETLDLDKAEVVRWKIGD